jgi:hypothetical protein
MLTDRLLLVVERYCAASSLARPTVSAMILKDSRTFDRIAGGGSLTVRNYERCMAWFSVHWPENLEWPSGIERPSVARTT